LHAARIVVEGNPFVGLFARCSDRIALLPLNASDRFVESMELTLKVKAVRASVADSKLVGLFCALNSRGAVLPCTSSREEAAALKKLGLDVAVVGGRLTAVGNNVLANDKAAVVNPGTPAADARAIGDCLGVEVVKRAVAGFPTVGSAGVVTNRGLLLHGSASDEELAELEGVFGVRGGTGTANMGIPYVGLSVCANSQGYLAGEKTSGFEMAGIDEALGFV
jgi:translation initiation factor 6